MNNSDFSNEVIAKLKFARQTISQFIQKEGPIQITLSGMLTSGGKFIGITTINAIYKK